MVAPASLDQDLLPASPLRGLAARPGARRLAPLLARAQVVAGSGEIGGDDPRVRAAGHALRDLAVASAVVGAGGVRIRALGPGAVAAGRGHHLLDRVLALHKGLAVEREVP